jgi:putative SOS response-associated peptidase YedK
MGGLWESWRRPDGEILRTACIITTGPNDVMEPIHDRMPVILRAEDWQAWLEAPVEAIQPLVMSLRRRCHAGLAGGSACEPYC